MTRYTVMLCCNDERGASSGRVTQVVVGDQLIHLEAPHERGLAIRFDGFVKIGRYVYPCSGRQSWVGNLFWESVEMATADARTLVARLLQYGWTITEQACDGPFAKYGRKAVGS